MFFLSLVLITIIKLSDQFVQENSFYEHYQDEHSFTQPYGGIYLKKIVLYFSFLFYEISHLNSYIDWDSFLGFLWDNNCYF